MNNFIRLILSVAISIVLAGCGSGLSEEEQKAQMRPDIDALAGVQRAVEQFQAETGVLPIKNSEEDTDIFLKYQIDFSKLMPKYLSVIPTNAFEQGGLFQYVLWDVEEKPTVKLIDLRVPETIREINIRQISKQYRQFGEQIAEYVYHINYEALGFEKALTVESPYSNTLLPLVYSAEGGIYVDYTIDLQQFIEKNNLKPTPGEDIRYLLADENILLPAYSLPYTVNENNEVVFNYDAVQNRADKIEKLKEEKAKQEQTNGENN